MSEPDRAITLNRRYLYRWLGQVQSAALRDDADTVLRLLSTFREVVDAVKPPDR